MNLSTGPEFLLYTFIYFSQCFIHLQSMEWGKGKRRVEPPCIMHTRKSYLKKVVCSLKIISVNDCMKCASMKNVCLYVDYRASLVVRWGGRLCAACHVPRLFGLTQFRATRWESTAVRQRINRRTNPLPSLLRASMWRDNYLSEGCRSMGRLIPRP